MVAGSLSAQPTAMELQTVDKAVEIVDRRGGVVPLDLEFVDENRRPVRLRDVLDGRRPVLLNLGYFGCPNLCGVVMDGMVDALNEVRLELDEEYLVVTVSIDGNEGPELARAKKNSYIEVLKRSGAESGWLFLTGPAETSKALSDAVGFQYQWNEFDRRWDHGSGLFVLSPDGVLSHVLQGLSYAPRDLRLALVEASAGKIGSTWDRILLTCYTYDPESRSYNLMVWTVVRIGGVLTVLALAGMILFLWRRERRQAQPSVAS